MINKSYRIGSYNIRKARGLDQKTRPDRILQVINDMHADVLVLQEADKRLGPRLPAIPRDMISRETDFELVDVSKNQISLGWHGNAVLVRRGLNVSTIERIDLPGFEPRGAVRVDIEGVTQFSIIATHLGLLRYSRLTQLSAIRDAVQGCRNAIIAGDMNEWSMQSGFEPLEGAFDVYAPGRSFHASRPIAALDRFALSKQAQFCDAGVIQNAAALRASDHLPVWCDVAFSV